MGQGRGRMRLRAHYGLVVRFRWHLNESIVWCWRYTFGGMYLDHSVLGPARIWKRRSLLDMLHGEAHLRTAIEEGSNM